VDTPLRHYSSGMYVRLAFSVAAHLEPDILILDEVFAVGDADFQKKCLGKMNDLGREGRTLVFVSHNLGAVEQLCTEALLLDGGRVAAHSRDVAGVVHAYLSREGSGTAAEWRNAGTEFAGDWFRPLRIALTDACGTTLTRAARRDEEIFVEIEADITDYDPQLRVGYAVYAETGELLFWSEHTDGSMHEWPRLAPGHNRLRAELPHGLLNEGGYRIALLAGVGEGDWALHPGAGSPAVNINVHGGFGGSPRWTGRRPGLIAPLARWSSRCDSPRLTTAPDSAENRTIVRTP
jgi:lipopolysaccharide transport system ATP-binding protein